MKRLLPLLFLIPLATGCSGDASTTTPAPTATVTVTETVTPDADPKTEPDPIPKQTIKFNNKLKLEWARSHNRKVMYQDYETAKFVVAHALENGQLGKPERYIETKWRPGQVGWGVIGVNNKWEPDMTKPTAFASVWFRADGSVDYSRGVTGMRIDAGPTTRGVIMYDVMNAAMSKHPPSYGVAIDQFGDKRGNVWSECIDNSGFCERQARGMRLTVTVDDLIMLDSAATTALNRSMAQLFGRDWRNM